jgi:hypothetical protein
MKKVSNPGPEGCAVMIGKTMTLSVWLIQAVFIMLKLTDVVSWSWALVMAPITCLIFFIGVIMMWAMWEVHKNRKKKRR